MAEARTQMSRVWFWAGAAVVLVAVFLVARYFLQDRLQVRVARVERESLQDTISNTGRVEPSTPYPFYSPLAATVKSVSVHEGDTVPAGKLILTLDDVAARAQVASAESAVKAAQASYDAATHNGTQAERQASEAEIEQDQLALDQAQHDVDALTKLAATGAASPGEVGAARQRVQTAQASLKAAQQNGQHRYSPDEIARAQAALNEAQAALVSAQHVEAQTAYYAPVAGTIYTLDAAPSEFEEAGKLLVEMADLHKERVRGYFDEPDLGRLAVGQKVTITWDARPGRVWHGHIEQLPVNVVTYTTRNVGEVLVALDGTEDDLLPDSNVTVTVTISSEEDVLSMPHEALQPGQNGRYFVYKVEGNELKRVEIKIGTPNLLRVPILSGLQEGDVVATGTANGQHLEENIPIKVVAR
jgi:HlyD family secretion protein